MGLMESQRTIEMLHNFFYVLTMCFLFVGGFLGFLAWYMQTGEGSYWLIVGFVSFFFWLIMHMLKILYKDKWDKYIDKVVSEK